MRDWRRYIGLPHQFGADPDTGIGADCLVMVFGLLDDLHLRHPQFEEQWLDLAAKGAWEELENLWAALTVPLAAPSEGAVTLLHNGTLGLGVGIVLDRGLLTVHHRRGVVWAPLCVLKPRTYYEFV